MNDKRVGQELRERFSRQSTDQARLKKAQQAAADMLGLIGTVALETVCSDIQNMLKGDRRRETDGYIFALSRIMKHDTAWACIVKAFANMNETVPARYFPLFNKKAEDIKPNRQMVVE